MRYFFVSYFWLSKDGEKGVESDVFALPTYPQGKKFRHYIHKAGGYRYKDVCVMNIQELTQEDYESWTDEDPS